MGTTFVAEDSEQDGWRHECNFYCRGDIHAHTLYTNGELPEGTVAISAGNRLDDIIEIRPAPEVPPIDPSDPQKREWTHRWLVMARARATTHKGNSPQ